MAPEPNPADNTVIADVVALPATPTPPAPAPVAAPKPAPKKAPAKKAAKPKAKAPAKKVVQPVAPKPVVVASKKPAPKKKPAAKKPAVSKPKPKPKPKKAAPKGKKKKMTHAEKLAAARSPENEVMPETVARAETVEDRLKALKARQQKVAPPPPPPTAKQKALATQRLRVHPGKVPVTKAVAALKHLADIGKPKKPVVAPTFVFRTRKVVAKSRKDLDKTVKKITKDDKGHATLHTKHGKTVKTVELPRMRSRLAHRMADAQVTPLRPIKMRTRIQKEAKLKKDANARYRGMRALAIETAPEDVPYGPRNWPGAKKTHVAACKKCTELFKAPRKRAKKGICYSCSLAAKEAEKEGQRTRPQICIKHYECGCGWAGFFRNDELAIVDHKRWNQRRDSVCNQFGVSAIPKPSASDIDRWHDEDVKRAMREKVKEQDAIDEAGKPRGRRSKKGRAMKVHPWETRIDEDMPPLNKRSIAFRRTGQPQTWFMGYYDPKKEVFVHCKNRDNDPIMVKDKGSYGDEDEQLERARKDLKRDMGEEWDDVAEALEKREEQEAEDEIPLIPMTTALGDVAAWIYHHNLAREVKFKFNR